MNPRAIEEQVTNNNTTAAELKVEVGKVRVGFTGPDSTALRSGPVVFLTLTRQLINKAQRQIFFHGHLNFSRMVMVMD